MRSDFSSLHSGFPAHVSVSENARENIVRTWKRKAHNNDSAEKTRHVETQRKTHHAFFRDGKCVERFNRKISHFKIKLLHVLLKYSKRKIQLSDNSLYLRKILGFVRWVGNESQFFMFLRIWFVNTGGVKAMLACRRCVGL